MSTEETFDMNACRREWEKKHKRGKVAGGILLVTAGVLYLLKQSGVEMPVWLLSWKTLLIGIGLVSGIKHGFRRFFWSIPIIIGVTFIISDNYPMLNLRPYVWPAIAIAIGLVMIFKPRKRYSNHHWKYHNKWKKHGEWKQKWEAANGAEVDPDDYIDSTNVFGGFKKNVVSKSFKGGDVSCFFGGGELNLTEADINEKASLEITAVFGGVRLIVPANWEIKSEITTFCGGIEDKRPLQSNENISADKVLILKGNAVFGGIEIDSF